MGYRDIHVCHGHSLGQILPLQGVSLPPPPETPTPETTVISSMENTLSFFFKQVVMAYLNQICIVLIPLPLSMSIKKNETPSAELLNATSKIVKTNFGGLMFI